MKFRDRIKHLVRVKASDLRAHHKNWRKHPQLQRDAVQGILAELGFAGALLAREREDGTLELVDGHLRAKLARDDMVPVLVLDVSEEEAEKILTTFDPLAEMAETDGTRLDALLADVQTDNEAVATVLEQLAINAQRSHELRGVDRVEVELDVPVSYQVAVECNCEEKQREVYERMTQEGFKCRVLTLC